MLQALKRCLKSNKSPNLVTLLTTQQLLLSENPDSPSEWHDWQITGLLGEFLRLNIGTFGWIWTLKYLLFKTFVYSHWTLQCSFVLWIVTIFYYKIVYYKLGNFTLNWSPCFPKCATIISIGQLLFILGHFYLHWATFIYIGSLFYIAALLFVLGQM